VILGDRDYGKGLRNAGLFYALGVVLTVFVHQMMGWEYKDSPPASFFVIFLVTFVGLVWAIANVFSLPNTNQRKKSAGELTIHALIFTAITGFCCYIYYTY